MNKWGQVLLPWRSYVDWRSWSVVLGKRPMVAPGCLLARLAFLVSLEKLVDANDTKLSPLSPQIVHTKIRATYWFPAGFRFLVAVADFWPYFSPPSGSRSR